MLTRMVSLLIIVSALIELKHSCFCPLLHQCLMNLVAYVNIVSLAVMKLIALVINYCNFGILIIN